MVDAVTITVWHDFRDHLPLMTATILLASTMPWSFPAQLAGAFAQQGARVEALCPNGAILTASRHVAHHTPHQALSPDAGLRQAIARARPDLVIPCDDQAAEMVQRVSGTPSLASRTGFLALAQQAGAPAAESIAVPDAAALETAMQRLGLPLAIKTDHSWGGDGVVIAGTREEARQAYQRLQETSRLRDLARALRRRRSYFLTRALYPRPPRISVQRFVAGEPATSSIACWQGRLVAAHHFDVLLTAHANGPASVVRRAVCGLMEDSARRIAAAFNLSGLFGLDYIRDAKGAVHLLEINPRATPTAHLALEHDLAAALLQAAGFAAQPRRAVTKSAEIALFPREWLRDPASPWLKNAYHDVPWDDPGVVRATIRATGAAARAATAAKLEETLSDFLVPAGENVAGL